MIAEMRNDKILVVKPETTAELVALQRFVGGRVSIEKAQPFAANVDVLKIIVARPVPEEPKKE